MLGSHPAALLFAVGNEIPPAVVRWHGQQARRRAFCEDLCADAKSASPHSLLIVCELPADRVSRRSTASTSARSTSTCTAKPDLRAYLARLQQIAGARPLLLAEAGADSIREGDRRAGRDHRDAHPRGVRGRTRAARWRSRGPTNGGVAGSQIDDWAFGLVDADRQPEAGVGGGQRGVCLGAVPGSTHADVAQGLGRRLRLQRRRHSR